MVRLSAVGKTFGDTVAVDAVSLDLLPGKFLTILGPSGCGKTTLLRLIAGFDQPTSGSILLHGQDISRLPPYERSVNTVFQSYALFPHMTVAQNIGFGLEMQGKPADEIKQTVSAMLKLVRMEQLRDRRTDQISGGQQQRVALARALAPRPKVLLLDEPLSALDYKLRKDMQIELKRLQHETGITFIFVTHDQEEALTMSDRVAVMSQGKILQIGSPRQIYDHPAERFVADFIGDTNFLTAEVVSVEGRRARLKLSSGREVAADLPEGLTPSGKVTAVIRPEHATLASTPDGDDAQLGGTLKTIVYMGTDTHYHVHLPDGDGFVVRSQNLRDSAEPFQTDQPVGVVFKADAVQVLKD
jgi:spermidine/putrescine transport system ATP-binding protein